MDDHIIPECYLDTNLMESLIPPIKGYNHQKGCNEVIRIMKNKFVGKFAIGILDIDKDSPDKLKSKQFDFISEKRSIKLYKHQSENHYLILHPNIEKWLIAECKQINLLLKNYSILESELNASSEPGKFKKPKKPVTSKSDSRFKNLFKALKENNAPGIIQLFKWTIYLITYNDEADMEELKKL